ncbi:MAG: hydroxymethylbilane synthase [Thermomicrobium sp.]|nr:hydroxymethylbilane synthase [Thermomicrobium sp.]MDW8058612.1 hydroxymethylbilane synthase [Thermomicrobium sp.]
MGHEANRVRDEIRIGTRASALALAQARAVAALLERLAPDIQTRLVPITTTGDRDRATSLTVIGGTGVFVKELHEALQAGTIDLAVHSAKDVPSVLPPGLELVAFPLRADVRDVLVARDARSLATLPTGARVGTGSRRRRALLAALRPDLEFSDIRGNVDTRLRKLADGLYDALVLAAAGLERLDRREWITEYLDPDLFVPAPGQGALAVVCRADDPRRDSLFARLDDAAIRLAVSVERAFLAAFGTGCAVPIAAYATVEGEAVRLRVAVAADERGPVDRRVELWPRHEAAARASELARRLAEALQARAPRPTMTVQSPLEGRHVLVVRPAGQAMELVERLRQLGAEVIVHPLVAIVPPDDWGTIDPVLRDLRRFDWVVFTSANGVRMLLDRLAMLDIPIGVLGGAQLAAIGPATARSLETRGLCVALVPERYVAEAVAEALVARGIRGQRVLLARAADARDVLPARLREAGAEVTVLPIYRTVPLPLAEEVRAELHAGGIDWVLLTASSTVRSLVAAFGDPRRFHPRVRFAAIGPVTAATAAELGLGVAAIAERHTIEGLIEALLQAERSER